MDDVAMLHLFNSVVAVYRSTLSFVDGVSSFSWELQGSPLDNVPCRLDLQFIRVGKDQPMAVEAGKAPERSGVLFFDSSYQLRAGDRLLCVPNSAGEIPVSGIFEIRAIPDTVQGFSSAHHSEVQIFEVAQELSGIFPGDSL